MIQVRKFKHTETGFSLIEAMIVIAILAITVYLATPSISAMYANNEVEAAQQDIAQSLRKAKQFARSVNTTVTVTLTLNPNDNTIAYTLPDGSNQLPDGIRLNSISLPSQIAVSSANDTNTFSFNSLGIIDNTGTITVTSARDANLTKSITLLNLLGQIQVD